MFEIECAVYLPIGYSLCEDTDFVYLMKNGEIAATFTHFVTIDSILNSINELNKAKT